MIGNLHFRVSDNDIKELFKEFGQIKRAAVHYDKSGRSLGNAEVVFTNRISAIKAKDKYNDVLLDGKQHLNLESTLDVKPFWKVFCLC